MAIDNKKEQEREELHRAIWAIADELRGAVDGWDFKNYVLGTMFYRYISENLREYINKGERELDPSFDYANLSDEEAEGAREDLVSVKGFYILPSELFCNVRKRASQDKDLNITLDEIFKKRNFSILLIYTIIKIMIDIHSAETNASGHNVNLWKTSKISKAQYQEALVWMADRYKNDDTIIAYDLKNEPHGKPFEGNEAAIWNNSKAENNWKYVAEETALKVLAVNPNVLIMVEGTEIYPIDIKANGDFKSTNEKDYYFNWWGGNLRGVKDYPINLGKYQNKLVYSPHDYGPTVFEQPWFEGNYTYDSLMKDCWKDNWFYIYEKGTAPLLIGEWGGFMREPNIKWMTYMRQLIGEYHLNHTFWCFNANSGDTGGLVLDDFTTWDQEKYEFVREVLWQNEDGQFIGLDHVVPLGVNGISLSDYDGVMIDLSVTPAPAGSGASSDAESEETIHTNSGEAAQESQDNSNSSIFEVTRGGKIAFAVAAASILAVIGIVVGIVIKNQRKSQ